jgi:hypothetical protein
MGLLRNHTGYRMWPLKGDQGENPPYAAQTQIDFNLDSIPLLTRDHLANYLVGLVLTIRGTIEGATDLTAGIRMRDLVRGLIDSLEITGAWHGRPINPQTFRGPTMNIIERIACGYAAWGRTNPPLLPNDDPQSFEIEIFVPLCHGLGEKPHHSAQLALLYKDATFYVNTTSVATLAGLDAGAPAVTATSLRCSAVLLPDSELRLGPANEWMEYRQNGATEGSDQVDLLGFGNQTSLQGVEPGAAVDTILALAGIAFDQVGGEAPDGSFTLDLLSRFSAPFLDQTQTQHLSPFVQALSQLLPYLGTDQGVAPLATSNVADSVLQQFTDFPYNGSSPADATACMNPGGLLFPIRFGSPDLEITKCPVFEGTVTYYRTISDTTGTVDRTLIHQFKSWTPAAIQQALDLIRQEKLALKVCGTNDLVPQIKTTRKNIGTMDAAKARFLPIKFAKAA